MGDYTYSKIKLGRSIAQHKLIPTKILSILLAILMVTTIFSSITLAEDGGDDPIGDGNGGSDENVGKHAESQRITFRSLLRDLIQQMREERKGIFSLKVVTNYKGIEKSTRLRAILPTSIDIDDDGDKDIRVWVIRRPALQLLPPSVGLKTSLLIRRLPGLEETQIDDALEVYLEFTPRLASKLSNDMINRVRIGYESPEGKEIPKSCLVYHKTFPQIIYPRQKTKHTVGINPISIAETSQLNLLFSIAGVDNDTAGSELMIQVNHSPAIKNEITFSRSKDRFIIRGQTLDISRSSTGKSNVSVFIKDVSILGKGSLVVNDIPKKISLSWKLARTGYLKLNSYSAGTGTVKAAVDGLMTMGFTAETGINAGIEWQNLGLRSFTKGKSFGLYFDTEDSMALSDFYLDAFLDDLGYNLGITSTLLALKLKAGVDVAKLVLKPAIEAESIDIDVDNADVVLEDCIVDLEFVGVPEIPTVTITSPEDDATVNGTVTITGTASAPDGKTIELVQIKIDGGERITVEGTTSWSYEWDTTTLANGEHKISAISIDDGGEESDPDSVTVTADNAGNNWYPLVTIDALPAIIQSDSVSISGTASDPDGDEQLSGVEVRIHTSNYKYDTGWIQADGTTTWSYEWDTSKLTGLYTIEARSYDGEDYTAAPSIAEKQVFIRFSSVLDITLGHASLDLKNFVVQGDVPFMNISSIDISSFYAAGSGAFYLGEETISVSAEGEIHLDNTSITVTNSSGGSEKLLDTLKADIVGDGRLDIVPKAVSAVLNANVDITAKEALGLNNIKLAFIGNISAHMAVDESGNVALGGDKKEDYFYMNIQDFVFALDTLVDVGADQLLINGTGNVSVTEDEITISGDLNECIIDNFHVNLGIANFSFSGAVDRIRNGVLSVSFTDLFNFSISYDGEYDLTILNPQVSIKSTSGNVSVLANKIMVRTDGFALFGYSKNETQAEVSLILQDIKFIGLCLYFDEFSFGPTDLGWNGTFHMKLAADLLILQGDDWIKIIIGGNGNVHIDLHTTLNYNGTKGPLDVVMDLATGSDTFVICLYNLSGNKSFYIDGDASVNITEFRLLLPGLVDISIERLTVGFDMNASGENGSILLDIDNAGIALDNGHIALSIDDAFNFSLAGTINVSSTGNVSGSISAAFNESGLTELSVDFDAEVTVDITNLDLTYNKTNISTAVFLSADQIAIGGSGYIAITPDYIAAGITTSDGGLGGGSKVPGEGEGVVLKNFSLNATDMLADINILADIGFLQIEGNLDINYSGDIILDASAGLTGENITLYARIHSIETYASVQISSFEISGDGGGTITIVDKNVSIISGEATNTDIIVKGLFVDVVYPDMLLFLMLEDANISFTGADVIISIDLTDGMVINAEFSGDAYVTINTLWMFLTNLLLLELRLYDVVLDGPTTITATVEGDVLLTIHSEGTISASEVSIIEFVHLFDVSGGPDISVGVDDLGNLLVGINGSWHFGRILLFGQVIGPIDFEGTIEPTILGFGGYSILGFAWIHLEGEASVPSTISTPNLKIILEPGCFVIHADGLDTIDGDTFLEILQVNLGILLYVESPIKVQLGLLFDNFTLIEGRGHLDANININSLSTYPERDIDVEVDATWNGEMALFEQRINITGAGSGYFALEASGSLGDGDLYGSLQLDWEGTMYFTIFPDILPNPLLGVRFAVDREAHVDFDFGSDPDSGDLIIETAEETIIFTQEGETIVMDENGEIVYQSTQGGQGGNSPLGGDGEGWELFDEDFYFWIWNPIFERWCPDWIEGPNLAASVTLLASEAGSPALMVNSIEIIPGDTLGFTAWYVSAEESGGSGHYNFVFDYGDGSDPQVIAVDYSDDPIIVHSNNHLYAQLGEYMATITVIDTASPDEAVGDGIPISIVDKYLSLSDRSLEWDYVDVAEDGKLYGSFEVRNRANKTYSNNYTLNWSIDVGTMPWGTDWLFEPMSGSLGPEESQVINVSFTPETYKKDYKGANIAVINDDKPEENKTLDFYVWYGLVEVFPEYPISVFVKKGETTTFNDVFWVYSNRWEELGWEVSEILLSDDTFSVNCIPQDGIIRPGNPPSEIALEIDASDDEFTGGWVKITVQRVGDPSDNDSVNITVKTISGGGGSGPTPDWVTPDAHENNWWSFEGRAHDNKLNKAAFYRRITDGGWTDDSLILTLDSSISCSGFRINAKSGDHLENMRIKLYNQGSEVQTTELTSWEDDDWEEIIFGSSAGQVDEARIQFKLENGYTYGGLDPHWAVVWEFDFLKES